MTATITSRGRVTSPKMICEHLHVTAGDRVDFVVRDGKVTIVPLTCDIRSLKGMLKSRRKRPASLAEMDEAIRQGAMRSMR